MTLMEESRVRQSRRIYSPQHAEDRPIAAAGASLQRMSLLRRLPLRAKVSTRHFRAKPKKQQNSPERVTLSLLMFLLVVIL